MRQYFDALKEEQTIPFATRTVREATGTTTRDDDPNEATLPPHMGKRMVYERWCWERGWVPTRKRKAIGEYSALDEFNNRPHDNRSETPQWLEGSESKEICSWPAFHKYWKLNYPNIKVRKKGADTCTDCRLFLNSINFCPETIPVGENELNDAVDGALSTLDKRKKEARDHVEKYKLQRAHANTAMEQSRTDARDGIQFTKRHFCLTFVMGQNLFFPAFNADQMGDTFYLVPITVLVFGVNDNSRPNGSDEMNVYLWHEKDGNRGANNIVSCLLKDYQKRGYFNGQLNNSLTVIADNCAGQNKNEDVVRFHAWLVEAGVFKTVSVVFLVKGHTKNACDRMFNLLKAGFHKKDIETYEELLAVVNENEHVDAVSMEPVEFYSVSKTLNRFYKHLKPSETSRTHIFSIDLDRGATTIYKKDDVEAQERIDDILPGARNRTCDKLTLEERDLAIKNLPAVLDNLVPPGIAK